MTTITVTYTDDEVDKFKRTTANHSEPNRLKTLDAVRDVLADVLWRVE